MVVDHIIAISMQGILEFAISLGYVIGVPLGGGLQEVHMNICRVLPDSCVLCHAAEYDLSLYSLHQGGWPFMVNISCMHPVLKQICMMVQIYAMSFILDMIR